MKNCLFIILEFFNSIGRQPSVKPTLYSELYRLTNFGTKLTFGRNKKGD
jgi:hypothetical protein